MKCNFCNRTFSTKSNLNLHQKRTKYCLKIQGELVKGEFSCDICNKNFTSKYYLANHSDACNTIRPIIQKSEEKARRLLKHIETLELKVSELKEEKKDLQNRYDKLATIGVSKSTVTNNNIIHNMAVFDKTQAEIDKTIDEKYDKKYLMQGQKGAARFACAHFLKPVNGKPVYTITDQSRGNGKYKVSETEVVSDPGMSGLTKKIYPSIKAKATKISKDDVEEFFDNQELFDGYQEILEMEEDNAEFRKYIIVCVK